MADRFDEKFPESTKALFGQGKFRNSNKESSGLAESADSLIGAPARTLIDQALKGNISMNGLQRVFHQIGADPELAPTGKDIVAQYTKYPDIQDLLGRAIDMGAQLPGTEYITPGVIGEIRGVKDMGKVADAVEAFAARGKAPQSTEAKIAAMHGNTGEVRDAVPKILDNTERELAVGKYKPKPPEPRIEPQKTDRAQNIVDEINDAVRGNEDFQIGDGAEDYHYYMHEGKSKTSDYRNIGPETQELIDWAKDKGFKDEHIFNALKKHSAVETHGIYSPDEHLEAWPLGEQEVQIDGLDDKLKELTPEEYKHVQRNSDAYVSDEPKDYVHHSMDDSVHYLMPDLEATKKTLSRMPKAKRGEVTPPEPAAPVQPNLSLVPGDKPDQYAHGGTVVQHFAQGGMPDIQWDSGPQQQPQGQPLDGGVDWDEDKYGGLSGMAASAGLGLLRGATLSASDVALTKSGLMKPETLEGYSNTNPGSSLFGEGVGMIGSTVAAPELAPAALIGKAGKATYAGIKGIEALKAASDTSKVMKVLGSVGAFTAGSAVEGALYSGIGNTLTEHALGDPTLNGEKVLSNFGQGAIVGGVLGGALKSLQIGVPEAVKAASEGITKTRDLLVGAGAGKGETGLIPKALMGMGEEGSLPFKLGEAIDNRAVNLNQEERIGVIKQITNTLTDVHNNIKSAFKNLNESFMPAERDALINTAAKPEVIQGIRQDAINNMDKAIALGQSDPNLYDQGAIAQLERERDKYVANLKNVEPAQIHSDMIESKQNLQSIAYDAVSGKKPATKELIAGVWGPMREATQNPDVFGFAGAAQAAHDEIQHEYFKFDPPNNKRTPFRVAFMEKGPNDRWIMSEQKVAGVLKSAASTNDKVRLTAVAKRGLLDAWFETASKIPGHMENTAANIPNELWEKSGLQGMQDIVGKSEQTANEMSEKYMKAVENQRGRKFGLLDTVAGGVSLHNPVIGAALEAANLVFHPLEAVNKLAAVEGMVNKATDAIGKGAKIIFDPTVKAIGKTRNPIIKSLSQDPEKSQKMQNDFSQIQSDPGAFAEKLGKNTEQLYNVAPQIAQSLQMSTSRAVQFLSSKIPSKPDSNPFQKPYEPSPTEMAKFERYYNVIEKPMSIFNQVRLGTLGTDHMEALAAVYPKLLDQMRQAVQLEATHQAKKGRELSYQLRQSVSMFLGQPITSSLLPQNVMNNQAVFMQSAQAQMQKNAKPASGLKDIDRAGSISLHPSDNADASA